MVTEIDCPNIEGAKAPIAFVLNTPLGLLLIFFRRHFQESIWLAISSKDQFSSPKIIYKFVWMVNLFIFLLKIGNWNCSQSKRLLRMLLNHIHQIDNLQIFGKIRLIYFWLLFYYITLIRYILINSKLFYLLKCINFSRQLL